MLIPIPQYGIGIVTSLVEIFFKKSYKSLKISFKSSGCKFDGRHSIYICAHNTLHFTRVLTPVVVTWI